MEEILTHLLTAPPSPRALEDVESWWAQHREVANAFGVPIDRALAGGFAADRPGYAFVAGYQEALDVLFGDPEADKAALCATEEEGAHPRAIRTELTQSGSGLLLSGRKQWITLGDHAERFYVVASTGRDADGRNRLAVVRVPANAAGITIEPMERPPFVPEISHVVVHFREVELEADQRYPGDGYADYLKPFRTVEDSFVFAAILAWVLQVGRRNDWPRPAIEELVETLVATRAVALADPASPAVHVAIGGLINGTRELLDRLPWDRADDEARERWHRDHALLSVAIGARNRRLDAAWERLDRARQPAHR